MKKFRGRRSPRTRVEGWNQWTKLEDPPTRIFLSITEAATDLGVNKRTIKRAVLSQQPVSNTGRRKRCARRRPLSSTHEREGSMTARRPDGMRYVRAFTIPTREPPAARVLVHNHVRHTPETVCSERGFRAWTQAKTRRLVCCACGWAPKVRVHYRVNPKIIAAGQTRSRAAALEKLVKNEGRKP
jgi:hypothetical protein